MRQLGTVLLLVLAAIPITGAKWKTKEKRFDAVAITDVRKAAGHYVGIDPDYMVDVRVDDTGRVTGSVTQFGVSYPLRDLQIAGADLFSTVGGLPFHGTFVRRWRNGAASAGLLVHDSDVRIDDVTLSEIFCRKA